jgi:hypothetical protein
MQLAGNACSLLVRVGPAPERTENPEDEPDAEFTDSFLVPLTEETAAELLDQGPEPLYALAAELWRRVATDGFGHMLIGLSRGLEAVGGGGVPRGCGATLASEEAPEIRYRPRGYAPVFAVARARRPAALPPDEADAPEFLDLSVDYRNSEGPGDTSVRPVVFDVGAPGGPPVRDPRLTTDDEAPAEPEEKKGPPPEGGGEPPFSRGPPV